MTVFQCRPVVTEELGTFHTSDVAEGRKRWEPGRETRPER